MVGAGNVERRGNGDRGEEELLEHPLKEGWEGEDEVRIRLEDQGRGHARKKERVATFGRWAIPLLNWR